jgi:hypothetical protein
MSKQMTNILFDMYGNKKKDGAKAKPSDFMISHDEESYIITLTSCTKEAQEEIVNAFQDWAEINDLTGKRFEICEDENEHEIVISLAKIMFCGSRLEDTTVDLEEMLDKYPTPIIEDENDDESKSDDGAQTKSSNAPATKASDNAGNKAPDPPKTKTPASYDFTKEEEAETDPEKFADSFLKRFGY